MESNTQAVAVEMLEAPAITSGITAKAPVELSATVIKAFFEGSDAEAVDRKVAGAEKSRLGYIVRLCKHTDLTTATKAVSDYLKDVKKESGWSPKRGGPRPPQAVLVSRVRASEIKSIYGAHRFGGWTPEGVGYHKAVSQAREVIAQKGINWRGEPEKTPAQAKFASDTKVQRGKIAAVEKAGDVLAKSKGRALTDAEMTELFQQAGLHYEAETVYQMAFKLVQRVGPQRAEQVAACIPQAIAEFVALTAKASEMGLNFPDLGTKAIKELREQVSTKS